MPWEAHKDEETGDMYYHNTESGETTWDKPSDFVEAEVEQSEAIWEAHKDESSGDTYYHNTVTGETTWDKPEGFQDAPPEESSVGASPERATGGFEPQNDFERTQQEIHDTAEARKSKRKRGLGYDGEAEPMAERLGQEGMTHQEQLDNQAAHVANHYNRRQDQHRQLNSSSPVTRLKNYNNWVKSVLINEYTKPNSNILDFCCGKFGDLNKWAHADVEFVTCVDIAAASVKDGLRRKTGGRGGRKDFGTQHIVADCFTCTGLLDHFRQTVPRFDVVSCQFALHYCFESEEKAKQALLNIASHMKPGGYFICTIPDAYVLSKKLCAAISQSEATDKPPSFGNSLYQVRFETTEWRKSMPFGIKYWFRLEGSIDGCYEYLIPFRTLEVLAKKVGLAVHRADNFHKFFHKFVQNPKHRGLLHKMQVAETDPGDGSPVEPMTDEEWDAAYIYTTVVFQKRADPNQKYVPTPSNYRGKQTPTPYENDIVYLS